MAETTRYKTPTPSLRVMLVPLALAQFICSFTGSNMNVASEATSRGLWPILDVVTTFEAAVNLYERCGWVRVGQVLGGTC
jgi:hypothetical protein